LQRVFKHLSLFGTQQRIGDLGIGELAASDVAGAD